MRRMDRRGSLPVRPAQESPRRQTRQRVSLRGSVAAIAALVVSAGVACTPVASTIRSEGPLAVEEPEAPSSPTVTAVPVVNEQLTDDEDTMALRQRIAAAAAVSVGDAPLVVGGVRYRFDCSGVTAGIYAKAGVLIVKEGALSSKALFALVDAEGALHRDRPLPGDLVFFDNTWDENKNGRVDDDPLSHVGVVEQVLPDGTVVFVHRIGKVVVRWHMNLQRPHDRVDEKGAVLNHWLRAARGRQPAATTAELFVSFGTLSGEALKSRLR